MGDCGHHFHGAVPGLWVSSGCRSAVPRVAEHFPGGKRDDCLGRVHGVGSRAAHK